MASSGEGGMPGWTARGLDSCSQLQREDGAHPIVIRPLSHTANFKMHPAHAVHEDKRFEWLCKSPIMMVERVVLG